MNTPLLLLVFNRPETTRIVLDAIRIAKPPRIYIACDGPREGVLGERDKVEAVRGLLSKVDWPCECKTLFHDTNLGCKYAVSTAISWFFEHEECGIILEDDCLPSQSFFSFCEELLLLYKDDNRVMHIDGTNFIGADSSFDADYSFSSYALIWGWATWRRAWSKYDINLACLDNFIRSESLLALFGDRNVERYWRKLLYLVRDSDFDTWDFQWFYCIWRNNGLSIRPAVNMIKNIGFGQDATHTRVSNKLFASMTCGDLTFPLSHPSLFRANLLQDKLCSRIRFGISTRNLLQGFLKEFLLKFIILSKGS